MATINIFYQGEGIAEIGHIEGDDDDTFAAIKAAIAERHNLGPEVLIYLEDADEPVSEDEKVGEHASRVGIKAHVHRCRHVNVSVTFNGETVAREFGPGTTISHIKKWAAEDKFKMSPQEASEHVLQISGTQERPDPGTHVGRLVKCPDCQIAFDLVPNERVNGAFDSEVGEV